MTINETGKAGIYVHIPFCVQKCNYCAFLSFRAGDELKDAYTEALIKEIKLRKNKNKKCDSLFFGGGTPSILSEQQLGRIFDAVIGSYDIDSNSEITIEANPATLTREKLCFYRSLGINRLSMGVQSMDDILLKSLGRIHSSEDVRHDYNLAREAGFDNINLDLIFAIPRSTRADISRSLSEICRMKPEHISYYSLQLEEGTPFYRAFEEDRLEEVSDRTDREMYHDGITYMRQQGYSHYEISNFAELGYECRHNLKYWSMADYVGLGLGASSFLDGVRKVNLSDINEYIGECGRGKLEFSSIYTNTEKDNISEAVFTGLRRTEGISYNNILGSREKFWQYYSSEKKEFMEFCNNGYIEITEKGFRLTLQGIDVSNQIMALFV